MLGTVMLNTFKLKCLQNSHLYAYILYIDFVLGTHQLFGIDILVWHPVFDNCDDSRKFSIFATDLERMAGEKKRDFVEASICSDKSPEISRAKSPPSVEDDRINEPVVQDLNGLPPLQVNVSDEGYPKSVKEARGHPIEQTMEENVYALHKELPEIHALLGLKRLYGFLRLLLL
ncbi:hypothetical protein Tco_0627324, partial [Tanacetum coccineum]